MTKNSFQSAPIVSSFFKWAGGKGWLVKKLAQEFYAHKKVLVEPFVGSAVFFLNYACEIAYLSDLNEDLINTYQWLKEDAFQLILQAKRYFSSCYNVPERYYQCREKFNRLPPQSIERAALFIYLNRHGYNGLCRYNRAGRFNVPFGRYNRPYFPEKELWCFAKKAQNAFFFCESFEKSFKRAKSLALPSDELLVYCDPPYAPLTSASHFPGYCASAFKKADQQQLAVNAEEFRSNAYGTVLISNHSLPETHKWYEQASHIEELLVARRIGRSITSRQPCKELLATYLP